MLIVPKYWKTWQVHGFNLTVYPQAVITREDAISAVAATEADKVDFLLVQHTSFSAGHLVPVLAKIRNANVGYWAIPKEKLLKGQYPSILFVQ